MLADDAGHRVLRAWLARDPDGTPLPVLLDRPGDDIWTTQGIAEELAVRLMAPDGDVLAAAREARPKGAERPGSRGSPGRCWAAPRSRSWCRSSIFRSCLLNCTFSGAHAHAHGANVALRVQTRARRARALCANGCRVGGVDVA